MATAKKQKNGKYRIQVFDYVDESGLRHYKSFTGETKAHAEFLAADYKQNHNEDIKTQKTVRDAVEEYIALHQTLSASSLLGYEKIARTRFKSLMAMPIMKVDNDVMQKAINQECDVITQYGKPVAAKTIKCSYALVASALKRYGKTFDVTLPKLTKRIKEFADPGDIMQAIKGTDVELPCLLAMWLTLSASEIKGLDCSAIRNGVLHVEKVRLYADGEVVEKSTGKVDTRIRNFEIPDYIMSLINNTDTYKKYAETGENGPLITLTHTQMYKHWTKIAKDNGFPKMTFHDLRAVSASVMLLLNVPDKYGMERGGWKSDHIMKSVYQQTFSKERLAVDQRINEYFESKMR